MTRDSKAVGKKQGRVIRYQETRAASHALVTAYREAVDEFRKAAAELKNQTDTLKRFVAAVTRSPGTVCFDRISGEDLPVGSGMPQAQWSSVDFPSPVTLDAALRHRQSARLNLVALWEELPAVMRQQLPPPPKS